MGESNAYRLIAWPNPGKTMKTKPQIAHHADEITPNAANPLGMSLDLNHKMLHTVDASP
jgi:hypothetical protein